MVVSLGNDLLEVDPGSSTPLTLTLENVGTETDTFETFVEGVDPAWVTLPPEPCRVPSGVSAQETILFRPQRVPESAAGNYPFHIRVRSINSGETRTVQGVVRVRPFHQLSLDVEPKRLVSRPYGRTPQFTLKIINLSNIEHTLQLFGSEPDNRCSFAFESEKVTIGPGQEREIAIEVTPVKQRWVAGVRLFGLSFSARSMNFSTVSSNAHAQLERRAAFSPVAAVMALLVLVLAIAWWQALPKRPVIEFFELDQSTVNSGQPVRVTWHVRDAYSIKIHASDNQELNSVQDKGKEQLVFVAGGEYTVTLTALRGSEITTLSRKVKVNPPIETPLPRIVSFRATPRTVFQDDKVVVEFELENVTSAKLFPGVGEIEPSTKSLSFVPNWVGKADLTLTVTNNEGQTAKQSISIEVQVKSAAVINRFEVSPKQTVASDGEVTVQWRLLNTAKATLWVGDNSYDIDPQQGSQSFILSETTTIKLVATDASGRKIESTSSVKVIPDPVTEPDDRGPTTTPPPNPTPITP